MNSSHSYVQKWGVFEYVGLFFMASSQFRFFAVGVFEIRKQSIN